MLKELLIFAVVLVALDIGVKLLLGKIFIHRAKTKVKRMASFKLADWHLRRYEKLNKRRK